MTSLSVNNYSYNKLSTKKYTDNILNVIYPSILNKYHNDNIRDIFKVQVANFLSGKKNKCSSGSEEDIISHSDHMDILHAQRGAQIAFESLYKSLKEFNLASFNIPNTSKPYTETEEDNIGNLKPDMIMEDLVWEDDFHLWKYTANSKVYICTNRKLKNAYTNHQLLNCPKNKYWVFIIDSQTLNKCPADSYCRQYVNKLAGIEFKIGLMYFTNYKGEIVENVQQDDISKIHFEAVSICCFSPKHLLGTGVSKWTVNCETKEVFGKSMSQDNGTFSETIKGKAIVLPNFCTVKAIESSKCLISIALATSIEDLLVSFKSIEETIAIPGKVKYIHVRDVVGLARDRRTALHIDNKTWTKEIAPSFGLLLKAIRKLNNYKKVEPSISPKNDGMNSKNNNQLTPLRIKRALSNEGIGLLNRALSNDES